MKVRTAEELSDRLAEDLIWRKKELTVLKALLTTARPDRKGPLLRALVALVYAHWEGFIKNTSHRYLEYLAERRLLYSELASNFVAISLRNQLSEATSQRNPAALIGVVDEMRRGLARRSRIPVNGAIDTASNLSSDVLREITAGLGLEYRHFESKAVMLDERLLANRNRIAHGEYLPVDEASTIELADEVQGLMDLYRNLVENAVVTGAYRHT